MANLIYDIETYPNIFTLAGKWAGSDSRILFEISTRRNDIKALVDFLIMMKEGDHAMVGFNNMGFDYPVIHYIFENKDYITVESIYQKATDIINTSWDARFSNVIWERDQHVKQIDLYKIHHFDNAARSTSLKVIEFNLKMDSVEDLPYPPGKLLTDQEMNELIKYNHHDVDATEEFYKKSLPQIEFRRHLSEQLGHNMMNFNDTKIGKDYFIKELEKAQPGCCYTKIGDKRAMVQTHRSIIHFKDILVPYLEFRHPEFQRILKWFQEKSIINTKGDFKLNAVIRGFEFVFGTGGIHGSIDSCTVVADDNYMIKDIDVASYYPNLAIKNRFYPEHLSETFCDIYSRLYDERQTHAKGTPENAMLKLALNGTYGDSNSEYSPLYDPQFTMAITINGQLLLCMLAESLMAHPDVMMIQINTDGLTIKCPRVLNDWVEQVMAWWEGFTLLSLEAAEYSRFFVRDVNNFIAEYTNGKLKRKGAYSSVVGGNVGAGEIGWHQDQSSLVIQKATEARLLRGEDPMTFVQNHKDIYDFLLRTKVPRTSRLVSVDYYGRDTLQQNVSRYYVSYFGEDLVKVMPPTPAQVARFEKGVNVYRDKRGQFIYAISQAQIEDVVKRKLECVETVYTAPDRRIGINRGYKATICNNINSIFPDDINYEWYVKEIEKLVKPIVDGGIR